MYDEYCILKEMIDIVLIVVEGEDYLLEVLSIVDCAAPLQDGFGNISQLLLNDQVVKFKDGRVTVFVLLQLA